MAGSTSGTGSGTTNSSSDSATISANDFLTLLVTEMKNQDPTANTDPNEYINQLVSVNSLEQLIDINQNLSTALGSSTPASGSGTPATQATASTSALTAKSVSGANAQTHGAGHKATALTAANSTAPTTPISTLPGAISQFAQAQGPAQAPGNLSIPGAKPASQRVAHALDGRSRSQ
jgi:flagellar basal-body rod modification protein FlgD